MPADEPHHRAFGRVGTTLKAKYRLDALIGVGGMAAVYRATHRNRAQLAVKVLHPELSHNPETRARFLREGYAANSVQHPGVVLVVDDDVADDGAAFLVMELLDGETVEHLAAGLGPRVPASIAVAIVHQLLDVLDAAHGAGVVHRDIKPANLFLTRDGTVKVLDFGIARVLETMDAGALATGTGVPIGTPAFMAPEQALARSGEIDARSDVWAAGATLFTLLAGVTVHPSPTSAEALVNAATRPAVSLASVAPDVPKPLVEVVDKALAFDKAARWSSARAMEEALVAAFVQVSGAPPSKSALTGLLPPRATTLPPTGGAHSAGLTPAQPSGPRAEPQEFASAPTLAAAQLPSGEGGPTVARPAAPRWRRALVAAGALAALAAAAAGLTIRAGARRGVEPDAAPTLTKAVRPPPDAPPLVLVFGIDNRTAEPLLDGTIDLVLGSELKTSATLYPYAGATMRALVSEEAPEAMGHDDRIGRELAERDNRPVTLVHGFVTQEGAGFSVSITAKDGASGAAIGETMAYAPNIGKVVRATADVACTLRSWLHDAPCDATSQSKTGLSESMEANHEFLIARTAFNNGNNADAEPHFARAIELDPGFAMAQLSLGLLMWNTGRAALGLPHLDVALARQDQLSDREKLVVLATEHVMKDELDDGVQAYAELLARWPADTTQRGNLAATLFGAGRMTEAMAAAQRNLTEHPRNVVVWGELAEMQAVSGNLEDAARVAHMVVANFSKPPSVTHAVGGAVDLLLGRKSAALGFYSLLGTTDPTARATVEADEAMFEGRLSDARAMLEKSARALEEKKATMEAQSTSATLAEVFLRRGELERARTAAKRGAMSGDLVTLVRAGRVLAHAGRPGEAEVVDKAILEHTGQRAPLFSRLVRAEVLLARHAPKEAILALGEIGTGPGSSLAHVIVGQAKLDLGSLDDALHELDGALARPGALAFTFYGEESTLRYVPPVAYSVARIKDLLHRPDAEDAYRAFLAMEPSAQDDPLVRSAKRRIGAP